jgi:rhodanese-related sulfurtransferase
MGQVLKRVGTGLWIVFAMLGVAAIVVVGWTQVDAQDPTGKDLLMPFSEFEPLNAASSVLVVDVRDAGSFAGGHIPGASHVPLREIEVELAAIKRAARGRVVVTYCSCPTEATSLIAARTLSRAGVKARALVGGFPRWVESGGAIERSSSD